MAGKNLFNSVKMTKPRSNFFDLSHDVKMSMNMGPLYPSMCMECIPSDRWNIGCEKLIRFAPLIAPVMHRFDAYSHYWFVPSRLLWPNWENFITNTLVAGLLPAYPTLEITNANWGPLMDYFGIPQPADGNSVEVSALPFAAYQFTWNENYRDQNLSTEIPYLLVDGDNTANFTALTTMRNRAWEHDYFTSALPFAQKGAAVNLPLGLTDAPVVLDTSAPGVFTIDTNIDGVPLSGDIVVPQEEITPTGTTRLYADMSDAAVAGTINDLRRAFKLQEWLEKAARGGSRLFENILSFFGVRSPDKRMQRPEYITGTKSPVVISEVLNTTGSETVPQGNMAGHGFTASGGKYGKYFVQEHGFILCLDSVLPKTSYQQGVERMWLKRSPFDLFWPQFAHIGEQEVNNKEIYIDTADPNGTFGYVPRYAEYKFANNRVAGEFRTSLNFWTASRIFATEPVLNNLFVESNPTDRIFAVEGSEDDHLYCQVLHKLAVYRPMPKFGTPSF